MTESTKFDGKKCSITTKSHYSDQHFQPDSFGKKKGLAYILPNETIWITWCFKGELATRTPNLIPQIDESGPKSIFWDPSLRRDYWVTDGGKDYQEEKNVQRH